MEERAHRGRRKVPGARRGRHDSERSNGRARKASPAHFTLCVRRHDYRTVGEVRLTEGQASKLALSGTEASHQFETGRPAGGRTKWGRCELTEGEGGQS